MKKHTRNTFVFSASLLAAALAQAGVGTVTTFGAGSTVFDVSADGKTVAGSFGGNDFIGSSVDGITRTIGGTAPGVGGLGGNVAISADGTRVGGQLKDPPTNKYVSAFYDTGNGGVTGSWTQGGTLGGASGSVSSTTWTMSSNGRYLAGSSYTATGNYSHAYVYDTATGTGRDITPSNGSTSSRIDAISGDGSIAVGYTANSRYGTIWRQQADGSFAQTIVTYPGTTSNAGELLALSDNGVWAAGVSSNTNNPYMVNTLTGAVSTFPKLAYADNGKANAAPSAISNDGQMIIGNHLPFSATGLAQSYGFIWTAAAGVQVFDDYLAGYGIDTANAYNFVSPLNMAQATDGSITFVGIAVSNLNGAQVGFAVTVPSAVPEPGSYAMLLGGLGLMALIVRRRKT